MTSASLPREQRLLQELVAIPSVHPDAESGGTKRGEEAIGAWMEDYLAKAGAGVQVHRWGENRLNVVGVFEPAAKAESTVLFAPHLDTVGVADMTVPPFELTREGDRLHGRGACDTKGPTAALLAALERWLRSSAARSRQTRIVVAATGGEEQGSLGAQALVEAGQRADFGIALEPTGLKVVRAAKGVLRLWITVPGRSAHGSTPDRGENAIYRALPLLAELKNEYAPFLASQSEETLGTCSLNLGVLEGGGELNLVPASCRIGLDIRFHPGFPADTILEQIRFLVERQAPGSRVTVHRKGPPFITPQDDAWAFRLRQAGKGWDTADWFCDANVFAASGISAVAFGPGIIEQAHTCDEYILASDLAEGAAGFHRFLESLA